MKPPFRLTRRLAASRRRLVLPRPALGADALYLGDDDRNVVKFDLGTLEEVWRIPAKRCRVVRAFQDSVLLSSNDGTRWAIRPSGEEIWRRRTGLYWAVWRECLITVRDAGLDVIEIGTGDCVDRIELGVDVTLKVVWGDLLFLSAKDGGDPFQLYDLAARRPLWDHRLLQEIGSAYKITARIPAVTFGIGSAGRYIATYARHTFGGSLDNGHLLWCSPHESIFALPDAEAGQICMLSEQDDLATHFVAIDELTGKTIYDVPIRGWDLPSRLGRAFGGIRLAEHIAYATESSALVVFRLSDGELVWSSWYGASLWGGVTDGQRLYISADDGNILVFESA